MKKIRVYTDESVDVAIAEGLKRRGGMRPNSRGYN
jgi:hypothetical protein